jgi:tetratricopeptide (TPR) repeat protein
MDCRNLAKTLAQVATWLACFIAFFIAVSSVARADTPASRATDVLLQARLYQFKFRAGDMSVIPPYVALLEEATQAQPDNADLWHAMGVAYLAQGARAMMPGGNPPDAMSALQKGPAALRRALQINPNHAEALAQQGAIQAMMATFMQAPGMAGKGLAAMNHAIELAPTSTRVRLLRGFTGLNVPDALRNHVAEAEDLDFLIQAADGTRAGDYVRIMRGDLYFETGKPDLARDVYRIVERSSSPAAADAKARLSALDHGGVAISDIKALRNAAGAQCTMCHSR